jgi:hypothetical protein
MGTSSTTLYSEDTACEARDEFVQHLARLRDPVQATEVLLCSWKDRIADVDEGPVFWLSLAATQWNYGCLDETVQSRAMEVVDKESDLHRWEGPDLKRRRARLLALKDKLLSEQPKARIPKVRRVVAVMSNKVFSPDDRALATSYALAKSPYPNEPRMQVLVEMLSSGSRGGGGVFLANCEYTEIQMDWLDPEALRISYPCRSVVVSQSDSIFYYGRTIRIVYQATDA